MTTELGEDSHGEERANKKDSRRKKIEKNGQCTVTPSLIIKPLKERGRERKRKRGEAVN